MVFLCIFISYCYTSSVITLSFVDSWQLERASSMAMLLQLLVTVAV
jgi:hypothetical protein